MTTRTTGFFRDRATDVTATDTAISQYSKTAPAGLHVVEGFDSCRIRFYGTDTDNDVFTIGVYLVDIDKQGGATPTEYHTQLLGTVTATLSSTLVGASEGIVTPTHFFADTVAWADTNSFTAEMLIYAGTAVADFPGTSNADIGELLISGLGGVYGIATFYTISTAPSANCLIKLDNVGVQGGA